MKLLLIGLALAGAAAFLAACSSKASGPATSGEPARAEARPAAAQDPLPKTDEEWKAKLTAEQYDVLRKHGTERPKTGAYWDNHQPGIYRCAGCGEILFKSSEKFDSGTGWPSFTAPAAGGAVSTQEDTSYNTVRNEVHCSKCGGHLGHVFTDGPQPTGLRYCINSVSLKFEEEKK